MPERSLKRRIASINCHFRLKWLENHRSCDIHKKGALKNEVKNHPIWNNARISNLKNSRLTFCSPGEWSSSGIDQELSMKALKNMSRKFPKLQSLGIKAIKYSLNNFFKKAKIRTVMTYESLLRLLTALSELQDFHHLEYEFLKYEFNKFFHIFSIFQAVKSVIWKS